MGSKTLSSSIPCMIFVVMLFGYASSNLDQDRAECTNQLVGLSTCLPYVGGQAKMPTGDCCNGVKQVVQKSMRCLCILVRDRNDPNLGLKINTTLALRLPSLCNAPTNVTQCIQLLHLAPSSADAKVFEDFARSLEHSNSTSTPVANATGSTSAGGGSSSEMKNDGGKGKIWLLEEMATGILLGLFTSYQLLL